MAQSVEGPRTGNEAEQPAEVPSVIEIRPLDKIETIGRKSIDG